MGGPWRIRTSTVAPLVMRRSTTPRPAAGRSSLQFLGIANGSPAKTETYLAMARRPEVADEERIAPVLARARQVGMMLNGLKRPSARSNSTVVRPPSTDDEQRANGRTGDGQRCHEGWLMIQFRGHSDYQPQTTD